MVETQRIVCGTVIGSLFIGVVLTAVLLSLSLKRLEMTEIGIKYDTLAKELGSETFTGGLHVGPVGFTFITAPSVYKTISSDITCLNKDGIEIKLSVSYQYKVKAKYFRKVLLELKTMDGLSKFLMYVGESVLHNVCSQFNTTNFQFERKRFTDTVQRSITEQFNIFYTEVAGLQISNYDRPDSFEKAIAEKMKAFEDINLASKERQAAIIQAQTDLKVAQAQADITMDNARSYENIRKTQASRTAAVIQEQLNNERKVYTSLMESKGLNFTAKGVLSYMRVRMLENAPNPVQLAVKNPI